MSKKTLRTLLDESSMLVTAGTNTQRLTPHSSNSGDDDLEDDDNSGSSSGGSDDDDNLNGGDDDDVLSGGLGDDELDGGDGDDDLDGEDDDDHLSGGRGSDSLHGGQGNDDLDGGDGDDDLDGGQGCDSMCGGDGDDDYFVDDTQDSVTELENQGNDTVNSSCSFTLEDNVENLVLTGRSGNSARGNTLDNVLTGNAGNNLLDGGAGADTMSGGAGNDTYIVDNALDQVMEHDASRTQADTVKTYVDYTLAANVEKLVMMVGGHTGTGNALDNLLTGSNGNDTLDGGAGADKMEGGSGSDLYFVDNAKDSVKENNSDKTSVDAVHSSVSYTLASNVENLTLTGNAIAGTGNSGNNQLFGNDMANTLSGKSGNDFLDGGLGDDILCGGSGADTFNFSANAGVDRVVDFDARQGDALDISDLLTGYDPLTGSLGDFVAITTDGADSVLSVDADGAGAGGFVQVARLMNVTGLEDEAALVASGTLIVA